MVIAGHFYLVFSHEGMEKHGGFFLFQVDLAALSLRVLAFASPVTDPNRNSSLREGTTKPACSRQAILQR